MDTLTPTPPNGGNPRQRLLRGTLLKWTENTGWLDRDGVRPSDGPYLLWGLEEGLQRWQNQTVVDEITDKPLPDLNELNGSIPQAQWEAGLDDHPRPPYVHQYAIYLLDPGDGQFYTLINSTVGMRMLWESLSERWEVMRHLRGPDVVAVVSLSDRPFRTGKWGIKLRPDLKILEWRKAAGGGPDKLAGPTTPQLPPSQPAGATSALPAPSTLAATTAAPAPTPSPPPRPEPPASPAARSAQASGAPTRPTSPPPTEQKSSGHKKEDGLAFLDPVKPITTSEEIDDAIPF